MDISKSGLKGRGLVVPGWLECEPSLNTGDPAKLVKTDKSCELTLTETLAKLYTAQNRLTVLINKVIVTGIIGNEEIECLTGISDALMHGINYTEYVRAAIKLLDVESSPE